MYNILQFGFGWCLVMINLDLCPISRKNSIHVKNSSPHIISRDTWLTIGDVNLDLLVGWYMPGFSTAELLFLSFHCLFSRSRSLSHYSRGRDLSCTPWKEVYQRICGYMLNLPCNLINQCLKEIFWGYAH